MTQAIATGSIEPDVAELDGVDGDADLAACRSYISALAGTVEDKLRQVSYRDHLFSAVAHDALRTVPVPTQLDVRRLLRLLVNARALPRQEDLAANFGDPPITVYRGHEFFISFLIWFDGTTSIHQHNFSGAFRVLQGSSLHCTYRYSPLERLGRDIALGELKRTFFEVLHQGDSRAIVVGPAFIHSLFHLDRPSATIVVRTYWDYTTEPQFNYKRPSLAVAPYQKDEELTRQLQGLAALKRFLPDSAVTEYVTMLSRLDFFRAYRVLEHCYRTFGDRVEVFEEVLARYGRHEPTFGEELRRTYAEKRWQDAIVAQRRHLHDPGHRLLLALALNLEDPGEIHDALQSLRPGADPTALVGDWLHELHDVHASATEGLTDDTLDEIVAAFSQGGLSQRELDAAGTLAAAARSPLISRLVRRDTPLQRSEPAPVAGAT